MRQLKPECIKKHIANGRLFFLQVSFFFVFTCVFLYLIKIQIVNPLEGGRTGQWEKIVKPVPRGTIYDRNGRILAISIPYYSLYIDSWKVNHQTRRDPLYPETLKKKLSSILNISHSRIEQQLQQPYPLIKRELSVEEYKTLLEKNLPGTVFIPSYQRVYPRGRFASHILGFVGIDGYGLEGIELYYDKILRGEKGISLILKDGKGDLIRSVERKLSIAKPGKDIYLTIDSNIQHIVEREIENVYSKYNASSVSVIVINYDTGEILALANKPDYDPNNPSNFPASNKRNRAVTDLFEPGSTFKIVTAAAAIEEGIVSPDDIIYCENGKWFIRNRFLRDVRPHGKLTVSEVIEKSSNIGIVKIALKLGEEKLYKYCRKFGFGQPTGIDLPGEIRGVLRPLDRWSGHSIIAVPIGQEVGINALQAIQAMAVIANGGYLIQPHILKKVRDSAPRNTISEQNHEKHRVLSEETAEILREILQSATGPASTGRRANIPGYSISGKTGTAQKFIDGRFSEDRFVASFVGFLNHENARLLILVKVDEPRPVYFGGLVAAPAFRNILQGSLQHLNIPPATLEEDRTLAMQNGTKRTY